MTDSVPRVRNVPIRAGENDGDTLPLRDIVRELVALGRWTGSVATFRLPAPAEQGLSSALLVQQGSGGPIARSTRLALVSR